MACQAMHMWTLTGLVAVFLDLAIAYLLLCAAAAVFFASKFLGFFGLNLPCPCDGLFLGLPTKEYCLNRLLVDFPTSRVSEIQVSVKRKFPFSDSVWDKSPSDRIVANDYVNRFLEVEDETSCSSVSDPTISRNVVRRDNKYDMKGKAVFDHRPRSRLRQRRRGGGGKGKYSSISFQDPSLQELTLGGESHSHFGTDDGRHRLSLQLVDDGFDAHYSDYDRNSIANGMTQNSPNSIQMNHYPEDEIYTTTTATTKPDNEIYMKTNISSIEKLQEKHSVVQNFSGDEKAALRFLEKSLEEEQAAHTALYIELEKERSAAASAADEAMAMILRLQEEKASIEMEARQYQRILEEKSAYDAEEMNILKEILLRREMEKHFLEKEVEAYRQMAALGKEQLIDEFSNKNDDRQLFGFAMDPDNDLGLLLRQLTASANKNIMTEMNYDLPSGIEFRDKQSGLEQPEDFDNMMSLSNDDGNMDLEEKEIVYADNGLNLTRNNSQEDNLDDNIVMEKNGIRQERLSQEFNPRLKHQTKDTCIGLNDNCDIMSDKESHVYDVYVVDDQIYFHDEDNGSKIERVSFSSCSNVGENDSVPFGDSVMERANFFADGPSTSGLPPLGPKGKTALSDLSGSSMFSLDSEMLKINSEVGRLCERLKIVQEEREKLNLSKESREMENVQLKLLEDIARQVQEIRLFTEPGKAARQFSLPLPTTKVFSKKRRCRSVSSGLRRTSEG